MAKEWPREEVTAVGEPLKEGEKRVGDISGLSVSGGDVCVCVCVRARAPGRTEEDEASGAVRRSTLRDMEREQERGCARRDESHAPTHDAPVSTTLSSMSASPMANVGCVRVCESDALENVRGPLVGGVCVESAGCAKVSREARLLRSSVLMLALVIPGARQHSEGREVTSR